MASYPKDRFDELPDDLVRIGAHRSPARRGRGWIMFAWAALATGILVFGGLFGISKFLDIDLGIGLFPVAEAPTPTPTPTPTIEPVTDPSTLDQSRGINITVLNGTPVVGLENTVGDALSNAGWPVVTKSNANSPDIEETFVYYTIPEDEGIARGIAAAIGVGGVRLVPQEEAPTSATFTVVVGSDYESVPAAG